MLHAGHGGCRDQSVISSRSVFRGRGGGNKHLSASGGVSGGVAGRVIEGGNSLLALRADIGMIPGESQEA